MSQQERDPLIEWNRLNKQNTENAIVESLFKAALSSGGKLESFCTWLLAGTGASAAIIIANIDSVSPFLTPLGFKFCGAALAASFVFGLLAKLYGALVQILYENSLQIKDLISPILDKHDAQEEQIQKLAAARGMHLETEISMNRVFELYLALFPRPLRWYVGRGLKNMPSYPHAGYASSMKYFFRLTFAISLQAMFFICFILSGFLFVK